jgi:hypothetical protein
MEFLFVRRGSIEKSALLMPMLVGGKRQSLGLYQCFIRDI